MSLSQFIFYAFIAVSTVNLLHFAFFLVGANVYDILQMKENAAKRKNPVRRRFLKNPLVTVAMSAHNEEKVIVRCLESIRLNTYQHVQVLVANDASKDKTASIVAAYIKDHPGFDISLYTTRKNIGKGAQLNKLLRNYAKGQYVMTLDADSILDKDAIANALARFEEDPRIMGVAANVRILDEDTLLGLLQRLEHMVGYRSKKVYSLTNSEIIIGGVASTYRMDIMRKVGFYDTDSQTEDIGLSMKIAALGNREHRLIYASEVVASTEGVESFKGLMKQRYRWKYGNLQNLVKQRKMIGNTNAKYSRMLTMYRMPMAVIGEIILLLEPFMLAYVGYLVWQLQNPAMLVGAYVTITLYLLFIVWPDEHASVRERVRLSLYSPIAYFVFYLMNVVQFSAVVRCLWNGHKIWSNKQASSTWVSPTRIGREVKLSV